MTRDRPFDDEAILEGDDTEDERRREALLHELFKREAAAYDPTIEELRDAEPLVRSLQARVNERRRELMARAAMVAPVPPNLADKSRAWLLARLAEIRELARQIPGGVQRARNLDVRELDDVPTEELRSEVADLEIAIAVERQAGRAP